MGRKSFFEVLARMMFREAVRATKSYSRSPRSRGGQTGAQKSKRTTQKRHRTKYFLPIAPIKLASRGMHAYPVNGESFYPENFASIRRLGEDEIYLRSYLMPDPTNPEDANAVAVTVGHNNQALVLGHIPRHAAKIFSEFLDGNAGECGARIYFSPSGQRNSVELDCAFPPRTEDEPDEGKSLFLTSGQADYSMSQVTTVGVRYSKDEIDKISASEAGAKYGIALLREGFVREPEILDAETLRVLGHPYQSISWDFNVFVRSYGGEVKVRYRLDLNEKGRPRLALDASSLPKFRRSRY